MVTCRSMAMVRRLKTEAESVMKVEFSRVNYCIGVRRSVIGFESKVLAIKVTFVSRFEAVRLFRNRYMVEWNLLLRMTAMSISRFFSTMV